ncbi:uncharacterized protein LOC143025694 [Oratosquilla oratoria]|uniref:uncharacterized protein LOC143025694 n=1 Tax=Oratosquilla oratoria TaxID=337810 RepID=UPI003F75D57F
MESSTHAVLPCLLTIAPGISMESREELQERWSCEKGLLEDHGLKVSRQKTEYLECNVTQGGAIFMQDHKLPKLEAFKYLGSYVAEDGDLEKEIDYRIKLAWDNWRRVSRVLCDKKISARVKGKLYKTVVRSALPYGAETWAQKKTPIPVVSRFS